MDLYGVKMNEFEVCELYIALKQHFNSKSYDFIKYNGKLKITTDIYDKRPDKKFFQKLSKHENPQNFIIANLIENKKLWVGDIVYNSESKDIYLKWKKRHMSLKYFFKEDLKKLKSDFNQNILIKENQYPLLLKLYLGKKVSLETISIICDITKCNEYWNNKLKNDIFFSDIQNLIVKYIPFIAYKKDEYIKIIIDFFNEK